MATSGKVPTLGFLARIANVVKLGFGLGSTPSVPLPAIRVARVRSLSQARTVRSLTTYRVRSLSPTRTVKGLP